MSAVKTVRPLTADRFADLERLFAGKGCGFAGNCWCMSYRLPRGWRAADGVKPADAKHALMADLAERGPPPGLIAYDATETPVGWVSVGPRADFPRLDRSKVMKAVDDVPAFAVVCFVVPTPHRGQGIAHALLAAAVDFAREQGAPAVEGYPIDKDKRAQSQFLWPGTGGLFRAAGFVELARREPERPFMRLTF
ncbi:MAG: GNAT family N-acetyltransferase [Pseudomonadota bacterium]